MAGSIWFTWTIARQFRGFRRWQTVWAVFAVGLLGMLESRLLVLAFALGVESEVLSWMQRYIASLQVCVGLFLGMWLLSRMLGQIQNPDRAPGRWGRSLW